MKKTCLLLIIAIITVMFNACGKSSTESPAITEETLTSNTSVKDDESQTTANNETVSVQESETRIVPTSFEGIYVNDKETHYVLIEGDYITVDDKAGSSISIKENDAKESTVYAFSHNGKEETFFDMDGSFMCSIDAEEGVHYCWHRVNEIPQLPAEEKEPFLLQDSGSALEPQLKEQPDSSSNNEPAEQTHDTSFLGKGYTQRVDFVDGTFEDHTIELTKLDDDGNLIELIYNGYTISLANVSSDYYDDEALLCGMCPGYGIKITYTYGHNQSGIYPPDTVSLDTGWGEGYDKNMPIIRDGIFTLATE